MANPLERFAQSQDHLKALYSFHLIFEFKKEVEAQFGRKISWDQLGEFVELMHSNPPAEIMEEKIKQVLRTGSVL